MISIYYSNPIIYVIISCYNTYLTLTLIHHFLAQ